MSDLLTGLMAGLVFVVLPATLMALVGLVIASSLVPAVLRAVLPSSNTRAKWITFGMLVILQLSWIALRVVPEIRGEKRGGGLFSLLDLLLLAAWVVLFASLYMYKRPPSPLQGRSQS